MIHIIPAILATAEEDFKIKLARIQDSGLFEGGWVHIDLADKKFVQNQTISSQELTNYQISLKTELHLMVEDPKSWIEKLNKIKIDRIIFHAEAGHGDIEDVVKLIKGRDIEVGLALNPQTSPMDIEKYLSDLDTVLIMTVEPGFQGQKFLPEVLPKIATIKKINPHLVIGVDGGVVPDTAKQIVLSGADYLVVGSYLRDGNLEEDLENLWESLR